MADPAPTIGHRPSVRSPPPGETSRGAGYDGGGRREQAPVAGRGREMRTLSAADTRQPGPDLSDEELMSRLAAGRQDALGPLHGRYAALVYHLAAQSIDRATAEEVVQDVF